MLFYLLFHLLWISPALAINLDLFYTPPTYSCPPSYFRAAGFNCSHVYDPLEIVGSKVMLGGINGTQYPIRGVGYSPVPPGVDLSVKPAGDYFTSTYSGMWDRDLPLISATGASAFRVWSWDFIADHSLFLDTIWQKCDCSPLRIFVPFTLTEQIYGDIQFPEQRAQVLMDYNNFLSRYKDYPSIFAFMIGNELNVDYASEVDFVMSLLNDMIQIKKKRGIKVPLTLPLSSDTSFEDLVDRYYEMVDLDFWSVQVYDLGRLQELIAFYRNRTAANPKPLIITEFGVDAMGSRAYDSYDQFGSTPPLNESAQAQLLTQFWNIIANNSDIVPGGFVMEYVDEWWKGDYPFATDRNESCPNLRSDKHNYCGSIITNQTFLNEEWLGIFEQLHVDYKISRDVYCIRPREAFFAIAQLWTNKNVTLEFDKYCAYVGLRGSFWYLVTPVMFLIVLLVVVEVRFNILLRKRDEEKEDKIERNAHTKVLLVDKSSKAKRAEELKAETIDIPAVKRFLSEMVQGSFYKLSTDLNTFEVAKMRVKNLIWDKIFSSREALASAKETRHQFTTVLDQEQDINRKQTTEPRMDEAPVRQIHTFFDMTEAERRVFFRCVAEVYNRYLEAYMMWKQTVIKSNSKFAKAKMRSEKACEKQLNDIVLWNMVNQCAGTIAHAPEKVCQVFYFTKRFVKAKFSSNGAGADQHKGMAPPDLADSLMKIFKVYYEDVKTKHLNYDDMNFDGQRNMGVKNTKVIEDSYTLHDAYFSAMHENKIFHEKSLAGMSEPQPTPKPRGISLTGKAKQPDQIPINLSESSSSLSPDGADKQRKGKNNIRSTIHLDRDKIPTDTAQYDKFGSIQLVDMRKDSMWNLDSERNQDKDFDMAAVSKIKKKAKKETTVKKYFPNLGGVLGCVVMFGWLLRINSWVIILSRYCGNNTICGSNELNLSSDVVDSRRRDMYFQLAFVDSTLGLAINILRFFVADIRNFTIVDFFKLVFHAAGFAASIIIHFNLGLPEHLIDEILIIYIAAAAVLAILTEIYLNIKRCPFVIPGRQDHIQSQRFTIGGFLLGNIMVGAAFVVVVFFTDWNSGTDITFLTTIFGVKIRGVTIIFAFLSVVFGFSFGLLFGNLRVKTAVREDSFRRVLKKDVFKDTMFQFRQLVFWVLVFGIQWVFLLHVVMPAVEKIDSNVCSCLGEKFETTDSTAERCDQRYAVMCWVALVMLWSSTILITFVSLNSAFTIVLLLVGLFSAIQQRVGSVQRWAEVSIFFSTIRSKCFSVVSKVMKDNPWYQINFWNEFIDSLYEDFLISKEERERLKYHNGGRRKPVFKPPPINKEAQRRVIKFCWSLEAMKKTSHAKIPEHRKQNMVRSMPGWTMLIPCHSETSVYLQADLLRPKTGRPRISTIEYVVATYPDEWANFSRYTRSNSDTNSPEDLLDDFLNTPILKGDELDSDIPVKGKCTQYEVDQICFFVSYRGQTLARTIKGMFNYRKALEKLAMMEEGVWFMSDREEQSRKTEEIQQMVKRKFQILLAYQIYSRNVKPGTLWNPEKKRAFDMMLMKFHDFDMVFPEDVQKEINGEKRKQHNSVMIRFLRNGKTKEYSIERPGELVIGEPKAENQHHALAFALNGVMQVNDMNMYTSLENGFKTPFVLHYFFNTPDDWEDPSSVIPKFRCIGFPEYTYTRTLSTVGDLMGSAEFCFVTIMQRVLGFLRVRCHYGHPDYFDGYWVRTRGGVSKASHLINTNEDIYSGYEIIGRGEKIKYIEYIEQEKGRESAFDNAFVFEAKLAKGAAQQVKSPHVYYLNENLPLLTRLSLFFGSIGFYITTMLMCLTIDFYIFTIVLFLASGTSYHMLGLLDGVVAVPWIIQIGYVQALPLLLELSIEQGIMDGILLFIRRLIIGMIFFVFHVRTKSYFFGQGLFSGKGGYMGTGRGFGLDRRNMLELYKFYFDSHFNNAIILLLACLVYIPVSGEDSAPILLRLLSVLLVVFSWLVAPILFNPYPTRESHREDVDQMVDWIRTSPDLSQNEIRKALVINADPKSSEAERKKKINEWWAGKESGSWKAYYIKATIEEWEAEDNLFRKPLEKIILFVQKFIFMFWKFLPWVLLCLPSWHYESLYYLFYVALCVILSTFMDRRYGDKHQHFTFMKISMVLIIIPLATLLYNADLSLKDLLVSMCLYIIVIYAIFTELFLGLYNNIIAKHLRTKETYQAFPKRVQINGIFFSMQKIWPVASLAVMTLVNIITVWICGALTSLLYNGVVADRWNRAYLLIKQQRQYDPAINPQNLIPTHKQTIVDVKGKTDSTKIDGVSVEVLDHIEEMQKKMNMMQEQMRRNMELMVKSKNLHPQASFLHNDAPMMAYDEIKHEIEQKTKMLMAENLPEKKKEAINIDLERLFIMLENTQEYKDETFLASKAKSAKNDPIDKKCLENMRARYSEQNQGFNPAAGERFRTLPTLHLIIMDPVEIVKKHAEEWKLFTLNGLVVEELRAIRANLPQFSRSQTRQLAWCQRLDDLIVQLETNPQMTMKSPRPVTKKITFAPTGSTIAPTTAKSFLLDQLKTTKSRHFER